MDWDKVRIFHAAAEAGSFTRAGDMLGLSQSAVSRQVSSLEEDLHVPLFYRHARGLILTEQGEMLYRTSHDVFVRMESIKTMLTDSRDKPNGVLRVTTTVGLGTSWLTPRIREFLELYPAIHLQLILLDEQLDIAMRQADCAIWLTAPTQPDIIQRKLFTVHFHMYASSDYLRRHGQPTTVEDLDGHRIITFGALAPGYLERINWLETAGREGSPREPVLRINNVHGLRRAVEAGIGLAILPDYLIPPDSSLVALPFEDDSMPQFDTYFAYPEELRDSKRLVVFRDFLLANARTWSF